MLVWIIPSKTYWTAQSCSVLSASFALFLLIKNLWNDFVLWYFVIYGHELLNFIDKFLKCCVVLEKWTHIFRRHITVWIAFSDSQRIVFPFKLRSYHLNRTYFIDDVFFRKICIDKRLCMYKLQERQLFHTCYFCILIPIINSIFNWINL